MLISVFRQSRHLVREREWCFNRIECSLGIVPENRIEWVALAEKKVHGGCVPENNESS